VAVTDERMARNEALFREVNEHVAGVSQRIDGLAEIDFLCECADGGCKEAITLHRAEYESVRSHPRQFLIVPGHAVPEIEVVREETPRYEIVRKVGAAGRLAEVTNPRERA